MNKERKSKFYPIFCSYAYLKKIVCNCCIIILVFLRASSFAALIPFLGMALQDESSVSELSFLEEAMVQIFNIVDLEVSMGGILSLVVTLMAIKSLLSYYAMKRLVISVLMWRWIFEKNG